MPVKNNCKMKAFWPIWKRKGIEKTKIIILNIYKEEKL